MISRRQVLAASLGAGAAAALPGRADAAENTVPDTLASVAGPGEWTGSVGFPVGFLGMAWTGSREGGVRFRTAAGWSLWRRLPPGNAQDGERYEALIPAGGAVGYEVRPPPGAIDVRLVALNTTDGPRRPTRASRVHGFAVARGPQPHGFPVLSRAGWGADETLRFGADGAELFPPRYFPVQALTVHHTVTAVADPDPAATVRAIYHFHTVTREFGDIGYHLLVDEAGTVYEGRWSGPDPIPVLDGRPDAAARTSDGAHVRGFNAGNVGVALLGDLTGVGPTAAAREALVGVLAGLAGAVGIDPLAAVDYVNPLSGATRHVPAISGHRDWRATECPGRTFHLMLPDVRREVGALLAAHAAMP